ncbi:hypothetical protein ACIP98_32000 [Streptomyces sp. NPDC088354]|uniref:hypothetical protein n=1 Tax=Streptomyces sp. NPDC088354 TaxID=3365856 RepID=UPI0038240C51
MAEFLGRTVEGRGTDDMRGYDQTLATRLARRAVEAVAPEELPQFAMTAEAFHRAPPSSWFVAPGRDEPLGLGLETVATLLSATALTASVHVLDHLAQQASERAAESVGRRVWFRLGRRRAAATRPTVTAEPPSAAQLTEVRRIARQTALRLQVPEEQARAIADAIVAELATIPAGPAGPPGSPEGSTP